MIALVGAHPRDLVPVQVFAHDHRCEAVDTAFVDSIMERSRPADSEISDKEHGFIEVAGLIGKEEEIPGRQVVGQDLTAAVVDSAADRGQRKTAKTIVLGHLPPVDALDELELGHPEMKSPEDEEDRQQQHHAASPDRTEILANLHYRSLFARCVIHLVGRSRAMIQPTRPHHSEVRTTLRRR